MPKVWTTKRKDADISIGVLLYIYSCLPKKPFFLNPHDFHLATSQQRELSVPSVRCAAMTDQLNHWQNHQRETSTFHFAWLVLPFAMAHFSWAAKKPIESSAYLGNSLLPCILSFAKTPLRTIFYFAIGNRKIVLVYVTITLYIYVTKEALKNLLTSHLPPTYDFGYLFSIFKFFAYIK